MMPGPELVDCDSCFGEGKIPLPFTLVQTSTPPEDEFVVCEKCKGTGVIPADQVARSQLTLNAGAGGLRRLLAWLIARRRWPSR